MKILDIKRLPPQSGEVGIEIEVEGRNLPANIKGWTRVHDGSLRGESCEYVISEPCLRKHVQLMLNRVEGAYQEAGTKVVESPRQSIHIHINVQDMTLTQVYNFAILFLIFERPLVEFCGDHRAGNLFCLRSSDAEGLITALEQAANPYRIETLNTQKIRYAAMNVSALFKYGSLEFRSMKGTADFGLVKRWINMLLSIKDAAMKFNTPIDIIEEFSKRGAAQFIEDVFGKEAITITAAPDWEEQMLEAMRSVQTIAYTGDWEGLSRAAKKARDGFDTVRMDEEKLQRVIAEARDEVARVGAIIDPPPAPEVPQPRGQVRVDRGGAFHNIDEWVVGA